MKRPNLVVTTFLVAGLTIAVLSGIIETVRAIAAILEKGPPLSVAYHSNSTGNTEVYVMNPDGTEQTRLTFDPRTNQQPDISPNGELIVYCANTISDTNPEGDFELFLMDNNGGNVTQLTSNGATAQDCWPRWSPNGRQIAYHSNVDGNFEIYVMDLDAAELFRVTFYAGVDQFPEWSPNGKQLVIRRDTDVYKINVDGAEAVRLTDAAPLNQMATWSPNGKHIAFMSSRDGYCAVYVMESDGSEETNLTAKPDGIPNNQFCNRAPAWSRDGQSIFFTSIRPESGLFENIFVMSKDGSNVTRLTFDNSTVSVAAVR